MRISDTLFSAAEQSQLQSFLDGLDRQDGMATSASASSRPPPSPSVHRQSSPTPVLLSSPYSRNETFASGVNPLPVLDKPSPSLSSSSSSQRRHTDSANKREGKRVKRHHPYPPLSHLPSSAESPYKSDADEEYEDPSSIPSPPEGLKSSGSGNSKSGRGRKPPHELLTDAQKKANHIASEQKRRANIRIGFDQLVDIVPTLSHCHRSESLILQKSADYIRQLVDTKNLLRERVRELQTVLGDVPDEDSSEGEMDYSF
ncbi:hypothetical protein BCR43DRAFT_485181 [Syncephalastrum racemosum]|uniref:BHLH domain-containing protein n=1 Tax=Syncephalastrum racemosum TaxID=13706 RepID=A0A1X2HM45_SYNRA|nr:hypothetical protein BCR43DRAFT_485181 [Syncephalastrum racemosum]